MDSASSGRHERRRSPRRRTVAWACAVAVAVITGACVTTRAPTVSHVHIGHTLTAHPATPNQQGFLSVAADEAQAARDLVQPITVEADPAAVRAALTALATHRGEAAFSFESAVREAAKHLQFAADSDDSSANVRDGAERFVRSMQGVLVRSELLDEYLAQALGDGTGDGELMELGQEVRALVMANLHGEDRDGNGTVGDSVDEYGLRQLERDVQLIAEAEQDPQYSIVDRWYLFNIFRLPNGKWAFRDRDGANGG